MKSFLLIAFSFLALSSQAQWCGNVASQIDVDRLLKNKKAVKDHGITRTNATTYIPVTFHIVKESNGDGGVTEDRIAAQLCALNNDYAEMDIVFFVKDGCFNYINSTFLYENPTNSASGSKMFQEKTLNGDGSVNIFICENADTGGLGTTLGYYDPFLDVIVMRKSEISAFAGTLSHELGHFFSLLHVFNGWDGTTWSAAEHGNPVSSQTSPGGVLNELADGSNCENAGDFLCDTPADYNLGFGWSGCSEYGGGCKDFNGELLDPDEKNFMSYFIGCDNYFFSQEQQDMIFADYNSSDRDFLETSYIPYVGALEEVNLETPIGDEIVNTFNNIQLDWNTVDNAMGYAVEVKRNLQTWKYFTKESYLILDNLSADRSYTWKVLAFSETGGCSSFTEEETFQTGSLVSNQELADFNISINPTVIKTDRINLNINENAIATINFYSVNGILIDSRKTSLHKGANAIELNSQMSAGMYLAQIEIENKIQTFKLIVQ